MSQFHRPIGDVLALEKLLPELDKPRIAGVGERRQAREVLVETCSVNSAGPVFSILLVDELIGMYG